MRQINKLRASDRETKGFTLIEVIAAVVMAGIVAALLVPLLGSALASGSAPANQMRETYALRSVMDAWVYRSRTEFEDDLEGLQLAINAEAGNNYTVLANGWITFDGAGQEQTGGASDFLRVTLARPGGGQLTFVFPPPVDD